LIVSIFVGAQPKKDININNKNILFKTKDMEPGLYLVATPIGNLDDITLRALNVLKNSEIIFCENTVNSKKLFKKHSIQTKYQKYTDHDFDKRKAEILEMLKNNKVISLISDSGSPLISDPGNQLVNFLYQHNIHIFSIPGPSALISGIQLSGFLNKKFFSFLGFLPKKPSQKISILEAQINNNLIIYTTKQQLEKDIEAIATIAENFEIIVLKELTKMFEERIHLSNDNYKEVDLKTIKGELVLAVNIISSSQKQEELSLNYVSTIVAQLGIKKAYQVVKTKYKISRNKFYEMAIRSNNE
jgi:16S rRNA (cytidine1402-2'-O)-methyltransferase